MHDMTGLQAKAGGEDRAAGRAMADAAAGGFQLRPGRAMDRAAHATAREQMFVGGVDDDIDIERGDVAEMDTHAIGDRLRHRNLLR